MGVDTTSRWPQRAAQLPQVGYQRSLSAEGVLSLAPTLLLGSREAGPPAALRQLRESGLSIEIVDYARSPEGVVNAILRIGALLDRNTQAENTIRQVRAAKNRLERAIQRQRHQPRVLFMLSIGRGTPMVSGVDTVADAMINLSGAVNAVDAYDGFKPLNAESIILANPDVILVTDRTLREIGGPDALLTLPGVKHTTAGRAACGGSSRGRSERCW